MQHLEASGTPVLYIGRTVFNPLNAKLNPICHLLALLGAHRILHVSRIRVKGQWVSLFAFCTGSFARGMKITVFIEKWSGRAGEACRRFFEQASVLL